MFSIPKKHEYEIVSEHVLSAIENPASCIFKISYASESPQILHFRIFTKDVDLLNHLLEHGFISNKSLCLQVISFIGQVRAEVLLELDDDKNPDNPSSAAALNRTNQLVTELQQTIKALQTEELDIPENDIGKQYQFKLKLSLLVQNYIYTVKKLNSEKYKNLSNNLDQIINLIDSYQFEESAAIDDSDVSETNYYNASPNKIGRMNNLDDVVKLYLAINAYTAPDAIRIKPQEIIIANKNRQEYNSRLGIKSFLNYIQYHPLRVAIFLFLAMLEFISVPALIPIFSSIGFLSFIGLGNPFILMSFFLTTTFSLINLAANLPSLIYKICHNIYSYFFPGQIEEPTCLCYSDYCDMANNSTKVFPDQKTKNPSQNIPIISSIVNFISGEYKNYSNWFFSYIQRNPFSFLLYKILRSMALFLSVLVPIGNLIYCTYIDIDKEIDREHNNNDHTTNIDTASVFDTPKPKRETAASKNIYESSMLNNVCKFIFNSFKLLAFKLPIALIHTASKILLSSLYVVFYLLINTLIQALQFLRVSLAYHPLLDTEKMITDFYYSVYYEQDCFVDYVYKGINDLAPFDSQIKQPHDQPLAATDLGAGVSIGRSLEISAGTDNVARALNFEDFEGSASSSDVDEVPSPSPSPSPSPRIPR